MYLAPKFPLLHRFSPWIPVILVTFLVWLTRHDALFWDTIQLAGKQADWYFQNDFRHFFLPERIDSGHPPLFGMYLAGCWKIFSRSLVVSHLAMLPGLWLLALGSYRLCAYYLRSPGWALAACLLLLADSVLLGQLLLVSPDIWLMAAFSWTLFGVLKKHSHSIILGAFVLCLISTRGMMTAAALYVFGLLQAKFIRHEELRIPDLFRRLWPFLPGALAGAGFLIAHALHTGWLGYHADSPWAGSFARVDADGFLKNVVVLGWRWLDYGRVFLWLVLFVLVWRNRKLTSRWWTPETRELAVLLAVLLLFYLPSFLLYTGLNGHRYLLPAFLSFSLLVLKIIYECRAKLAYVIALIGLLSGYFWIYPAHIAQQWDATPQFRQHFEIRKSVFEFLEQQNIPLEAVGTVFPEIGPRDWRDLNGKAEGFSRFGPDSRYVFRSSVMNDFGDSVLAEFEGDAYRVIFKTDSGLLEGVLYERILAEGE